MPSWLKKRDQVYENLNVQEKEKNIVFNAIFHSGFVIKFGIKVRLFAFKSHARKNNHKGIIKELPQPFLWR